MANRRNPVRHLYLVLSGIFPSFFKLLQCIPQAYGIISLLQCIPLSYIFTITAIACKGWPGCVLNISFPLDEISTALPPY